MKYFKELSKEDQERAVTKLLLKPRCKYPSILRAKVTCGGYPNALILSACNVIRFYWINDILYADIVLDVDNSTIIRNIKASKLYYCDDPQPKESNNHDAKKALMVLLNTSDSYMFDNKCNAYPV